MYVYADAKRLGNMIVPGDADCHAGFAGLPRFSNTTQ